MSRYDSHQICQELTDRQNEHNDLIARRANSAMCVLFAVAYALVGAAVLVVYLLPCPGNQLC